MEKRRKIRTGPKDLSISAISWRPQPPLWKAIMLNDPLELFWVRGIRSKFYIPCKSVIACRSPYKCNMTLGEVASQQWYILLWRVTTEVFLIAALLTTKGVHSSVLKWKSGWWIILFILQPMSLMLHQLNTPVHSQHRVLLSSPCTFSLFLLMLLLKDPKLYLPLEREAGMWEVLA